MFSSWNPIYYVGLKKLSTAILASKDIRCDAEHLMSFTSCHIFLHYFNSFTYSYINCHILIHYCKWDIFNILIRYCKWDILRNSSSFQYLRFPPGWRTNCLMKIPTHHNKKRNYHFRSGTTWKPALTCASNTYQISTSHMTFIRIVHGYYTSSLRIEKKPHLRNSWRTI